MKKRSLALLLAMLMVGLLVGCATDAEPQANPTTAQAESATTVQATTTEAEAKTTEAESATKTESATEVEATTTTEATTTESATTTTNKETTTTTKATITTVGSQAGHNHATTADPHAGHNHATTTDKAEDSSPALKFDEIVTLTLGGQPQGNARVYRDMSAGEPNYTLMLTAQIDLAQIQLISLDPKTGAPEKVLSTFPVLKKGESQYVFIHVNDANPNRGIICTDRQGNKWHYSFVYAGQSGRVFLGYFRPEA